jgi:uncharacterized protein
MNNKEYEIALKTAENKINASKESIPKDIRKMEESLFQKITTSKHDRIKTLELLFSEMDAIYNFVHQFTLCKKGCSYCCKYGISISELEVDYIKKKVKLDKVLAKTVDSSCPFLKEGICSIYNERPFFCRRHLAFYDSPEWCELDISHNYRFPNIDCTEIDKCYAYLIGPHGQDSMQDIRQAFNIEGGDHCCSG